MKGSAAGGGDAATLDFYSREAASYADHAAGEERSPRLARFAAMLPPGGDVLDFGCGSGWVAHRLNGMGSGRGASTARRAWPRRPGGGTGWT